MRVSGKGLTREGAGLLGAYSRRAQDCWEIDTDGIDESIKGYVEQAAAADRYSVSGLCIALGITRETLELWRAGYVCRPDVRDKRTAPNDALSACIAKGELYVHRYWEESEKSTTLHAKFLESAGLLGGAKQQPGRKPPFDLGRLKKYCR